MREEDKLDLPELPFHSPDEKDEWYKFVCPKCNLEDEVPGFVVDEFAMGLKKGEKVGVACPRCGKEMNFKFTFYR